MSGNSFMQTVHTHRASVHQAAKLVVALFRVARVTGGLMESNGSLPPGLWLTSPAGCLPRTEISSGTLRSVIEYELPLPFLLRCQRAEVKDKQRPDMCLANPGSWKSSAAYSKDMQWRNCMGRSDARIQPSHGQTQTQLTNCSRNITPCRDVSTLSSLDFIRAVSSASTCQCKCTFPAA